MDNASFKQQNNYNSNSSSYGDDSDYGNRHRNQNEQDGEDRKVAGWSNNQEPEGRQQELQHGQEGRDQVQARNHPQQNQNGWGLGGPVQGAPHLGQGGQPQHFPAQGQNTAGNQRQGGEDYGGFGGIPWNERQQQQGSQQQQQRRQGVQAEDDRNGGWNQGAQQRQQQQNHGFANEFRGGYRPQRRQEGPNRDEWENNRRIAMNGREQQQCHGEHNWNQGQHQGGQSRRQEHDEWGNNRSIGACGHTNGAMNQGGHPPQQRQGGQPPHGQNWGSNQQYGCQHQPRRQDDQYQNDGRNSYHTGGYDQGGHPPQQRQGGQQLHGQNWDLNQQQGGQQQSRRQEGQDGFVNSRPIGACGHGGQGWDQDRRQQGPPPQRQNFVQNQQQRGQHQPQGGYDQYDWDNIENQDDEWGNDSPMQAGGQGNYNEHQINYRPFGEYAREERERRQTEMGSNSFEFYNSNFLRNQQQENPRNNQGSDGHRDFNYQVEMAQNNYQQNHGGDRYHGGGGFGNSGEHHFNGNQNQRREQSYGLGGHGQQEQQMAQNSYQQNNGGDHYRGGFGGFDDAGRRHFSGNQNQQREQNYGFGGHGQQEQQMAQNNDQQNNGGDRYRGGFGDAGGRHFSGNQNQHREQGYGQQEQQRFYDRNYDNDRWSQGYVESPVRRPESQNSYYDQYQNMQVNIPDGRSQHSQQSNWNVYEQRNSGRLNTSPVEYHGVLVEAPKENAGANVNPLAGVNPGQAVADEVQRQHAELRQKLKKSEEMCFGIFLPNPVEHQQWAFILRNAREKSPESLLTLEDIGVVTPGVLEILNERWKKEEEEKKKLFEQMGKGPKGPGWPAHPVAQALEQANGGPKTREQLMKEIEEQKRRKELEKAKKEQDDMRAARLKALETREQKDKSKVEESLQKMALKE